MHIPTQCHVDTTLRIIGGKWKIIILWYLMQETLRFNELEKRIPAITQKMLTQQLREMERDNLITRKVYPVIPPKVEYAITEYGLSLKKALSELSIWGENYTKNHAQEAVHHSIKL